MEEIYIVQRGDTLYGIAKEFDTSVQSIIENNDLIDNIIYVGQSLVIVKDGDSTPGENISYIVQKGDNLYSIARKYDTTVNEIKRYNNLSSNLLSIGQKLVIPMMEKNPYKKSLCCTLETKTLEINCIPKTFFKINRKVI